MALVCAVQLLLNSLVQSKISFIAIVHYAEKIAEQLMQLTAYATNGFINVNEFNLIDLQNKLKTYEFKPGKNRHFCSECASPIYSSNAENPDKLRIRLGISDSNIAERPISHNFLSSKANWDVLDANLPKYDSFEPSRLK